LEKERRKIVIKTDIDKANIDKTMSRVPTRSDKKWQQITCFIF